MLRGSVKGSLKRRMRWTFGGINILSVLVLTLLMALLMGFAMSMLSELVSESVAKQMVKALTLNDEIKPEALGEPYVLVGAQMDPPLSLIHYTVYMNNALYYDSLNNTPLSLERARNRDRWLFAEGINALHRADFKAVGTRPSGYVEVSLHPLIVYVFLGLVSFIGLIGAFLVIALTLFAVRLFTPSVIKPLNDLDRRLEEIAKGEVNEVLEADMVFKRPVLEVEKLKGHTLGIIRRMRDYIGQNTLLMQHIEQGIFQIDEDLNLVEGWSKETERFLGDHLRDFDIASWLATHGEGEAALIRELLQQTFDATGLSQEVYLSLLPTEVHLSSGQAVVLVAYKPIQATDGAKRMMIILTDVTLPRQLEALRIQEQQHLKTVVKAMRYAPMVRDLLSSYKAFVPQAYRLYVDDFQTLKHELHTFKGNFAQMDWQASAKHIHELEDLLSQNLSDKQMAEMLSPDHLDQVTAHDITTVEAHLGEDFFMASEEVMVPKHKLLRLEQRLRELMSQEEANELVPLVRQLRYVSISRLLEPLADYLEVLSERLDKPCEPLKISAEEVWIDPDYYREPLASLVHLLRNSIDHGIESSEIRAEAGKPVKGQIEVQALSVPGGFKLLFKDDGSGFQDKQVQVSEISGRGVGVSAVRAAVLSVGGEFSWHSEPGRGTVFDLFFPEHLEGNDLTTPSEFLKGLMQQIIEGNAASGLKPLLRSHATSSNHIALKDKTAIINLKGTMNLIVMVSIDLMLLRELMSQWLLFEVAPEDEETYLDDLIGEFANTMVGNALEDFDHREDIFQLGIPVVLGHSSGYIKYAQDLISSSEFEFSKGTLGVHLIPIHSEFIVKKTKEEATWREYSSSTTH